MKSMSELVEWFQLQYPDLVKKMKICDHNFTEQDQYILSKDNFVSLSDEYKAIDVNPFPNYTLYKLQHNYQQSIPFYYLLYPLHCINTFHYFFYYLFSPS